ncbi:unnamed protein product [Adineta ricciae]|uniref:Uncharacterized protein n=1 Tax=Adineta ricciae TaxID=249248 RepID=A0A816FYL6_ADIRI|nr:unnamed protein product [Adineta ricciae]
MTLRFLIIIVVAVNCGIDLSRTPSFVDTSNRSGTILRNYIVKSPSLSPTNDHCRLALANINGDAIVMHSLYPNILKNILLEHLVFINNKDGTFTDFSDESRLRDVQAAVFFRLR